MMLCQTVPSSRLLLIIRHASVSRHCFREIMVPVDDLCIGLLGRGGAVKMCAIFSSSQLDLSRRIGSVSSSMSRRRNSFRRDLVGEGLSN